jgi:hypothetical protein
MLGAQRHGLGKQTGTIKGLLFSKISMTEADNGIITDNRIGQVGLMSKE